MPTMFYVPARRTIIRIEPKPTLWARLRAWLTRSF